VEVCTADYTVVAADLTGTPLTNTATVDATTPDGDPIVSDPSTVNIAEVLPATASRTSGLADTGSTIAWSYGILALALAAAGAVILFIRRRRRSA
jgi:LPXTG-motif cell wall-anchored protein